VGSSNNRSSRRFGLVLLRMPQDDPGDTCRPFLHDQYPDDSQKSSYRNNNLLNIERACLSFKMAERVLLESVSRSPDGAAGRRKVELISTSRGDEDMAGEDLESEDLEDEDTEDEEESFGDVVGDSQQILFQSQTPTPMGGQKGKNIAAGGEDPDEFEPRWIKEQSSQSSSQCQCIHIRKDKV
jgi:hypothetical protein